MKVNIKVRGKLMGIGETIKNRKKFLKVYDGNSIVNVFTERDYSEMVGQDVEIISQMITDNYYIRELVE